jgi:hypothetical protein
MAKSIPMIQEVKPYTRKDGKAAIYTGYYVSVAGVQIELRPLDKTASQILDNYFKNV